jgi:hypothetical protein
VGNFTVRLAPLEAAPPAGSMADASDAVTKEPSATQSPLNLRRVSNCIFTPYTIPSTAPIAAGRDGFSVIVLGWHTKDEGCSLVRSKSDGGAKFLARGIRVASPRFSIGCVPTPWREPRGRHAPACQRLNSFSDNVDDAPFDFRKQSRANFPK